MRDCPNCGNVYPDPFQFCPVDGGELRIQAEPTIEGAEPVPLFPSPDPPAAAPASISVRTLMVGFGILLLMAVVSFTSVFLYQYWKPKYGSLVVKTTPIGATIFVDGKLRGITPLTIGELRS